jgi:hypothetical protein
MRPVSTRALQGMLAQETGEVFLICLTLSHPTLPAPYYLVNDYNPLVRNISSGTFNIRFIEIHPVPHSLAGKIVTITVDEATPLTALTGESMSLEGLTTVPALNGLVANQITVISDSKFSFGILFGLAPFMSIEAETGTCTDAQEVTFQPFAFDVNLPDERDDQLPQVTMTIDNIDNEILQAIRNIPGQRPETRLEVVLASSPDTVEAGPFNFSILSINYTDANIQGTIGFEDDVLNTAFPADTYTPTNSKGLFP